MNNKVEYKRFNPSDNKGLLPELIRCYRQVFSEEPWNEWKRCQVCDVKWGLAERHIIRALGFKHCGVRVVDFWPVKTVRENIRNDIPANASCWLALVDQRIIGFCWGNPITPEDFENKVGSRGQGIALRLREQFGNIAYIAYQNEIGVLKEWRGRKIAKELFIRRLRDFHRAGLAVGVVRTKTNPPTITYIWYKKLGYAVIAELHDQDGRVVLARSLVDIRDMC